MIAMLSPAMNMQPVDRPDIVATGPLFADQAAAWAAMLSAYSPHQLESLLKCNAQIACRAYLQYQDFPHADKTPALLAFHGLAYQNLGADNFSPEDLAFAQDHLRLLSALYGLLRPLDAIAPYRLDFMGRFRPGGQTLYQHWGNRVCRALYGEGDTVVSLASGEYERLVRPHLQPGQRFLGCRFLVLREGRYRNLATEAKMARGTMARFIVKERVDRPEGLRDFDGGGYAFSLPQSGENELVFLKDR